MKRNFAILALAASGLVCAQAQTAPAPAPAAPVTAKVAVIAFQAAVAQTNEFQRDFADLQKKYEPRRAQLKTMGDDIESLEKQLQAQGDKLSESDRASKTKAIEDKKKNAQRFAEDAQNDYGTEMNDLFNKIAPKVLEVMNGYAQTAGFTLVVDGSTNQQQQPIILYAAQNTDITRAVIEAYNTKSGVPAPPPQAPSAPTPAAKTGAAK